MCFQSTLFLYSTNFSCQSMIKQNLFLQKTQRFQELWWTNIWWTTFILEKLVLTWDFRVQIKFEQFMWHVKLFSCFWFLSVEYYHTANKDSLRKLSNEFLSLKCCNCFFPASVPVIWVYKIIHLAENITKINNPKNNSHPMANCWHQEFVWEKT